MTFSGAESLFFIFYLFEEKKEIKKKNPRFKPHSRDINYLELRTFFGIAHLNGKHIKI